MHTQILKLKVQMIMNKQPYCILKLMVQMILNTQAYIKTHGPNDSEYASIH